MPDPADDEILDALEAAGGNIHAASRALGCRRSSLDWRLGHKPELATAWDGLRRRLKAEGKFDTNEKRGKAQRNRQSRPSAAEIVAAQHEDEENPFVALARVQSLLDKATVTNWRTTLTAIRDTACRGLGEK